MDILILPLFTSSAPLKESIIFKKKVFRNLGLCKIKKLLKIITILYYLRMDNKKIDGSIIFAQHAKIILFLQYAHNYITIGQTHQHLQEDWVPRSMWGESCGKILFWETQQFHEWHTPNPHVKVTKLSQLCTKIIATRVCLHFLNNNP